MGSNREQEPVWANLQAALGKRAAYPPGSLPQKAERMPKFSWEEIKELLEKSISEGFEAELRLGFADRAQEYMLIIYEDGCSFGRCGRPEEQTIEWFDTLDALYAAEQADGILLERDWGKISWMECLDFEMLGYWE